MPSEACSESVRSIEQSKMTPYSDAERIYPELSEADKVRGFLELVQMFRTGSCIQHLGGSDRTEGSEPETSSG